MMVTHIHLSSTLGALLSNIACQSSFAEPTKDEVIAQMRPYDGPTAKGVDRTTLTGKVMAGYQGWFTTPGDGSGQGWRHYSNHGGFRPGCCKIDLWPDVSELGEDEKYPLSYLPCTLPALLYSCSWDRDGLRSMPCCSGALPSKKAHKVGSW
jgi:hypothetical protein